MNFSRIVSTNSLMYTEIDLLNIKGKGHIMDPVSLATSAVGMLIPYLVKGGEAVAKKAVDESFELAGKLYRNIRDKFAGDAYARETLKRVEENPESESRKAALAGVLEEKINEDASFGTDLEKILALAKELGGDQINQTINLSGNAKAGNINMIGKVNGNIDINRKSG
jgi:hypothetical protein